MKYQIIDSKTGLVFATFSTRNRTSRKADKLDLQYGAIRYSVRPVPMGVAR